jgi:hypothetical protein
LAFDAFKRGKLGKEVEATLRQNVGKNFLAKRKQDRKIRDLAAARERGRTPTGVGCAYGLTKRAIKIPFGGPEHKEKRGIDRDPRRRLPFRVVPHAWPAAKSHVLPESPDFGRAL